MTNRYSRNQTSLQDYARKLQSDNLAEWTSRGISPTTGRQITGNTSGRSAISRNVRTGGTSTGPGRWTAGGTDPLDALRVSANNQGRTAGLWSSDLRHPVTGDITPGQRVRAPQDGAISGIDKLAKYKYEAPSRAYNSAETLMRNGFLGAANTAGNVFMNKDGFAVNAPKNQDQLDAIQSGDLNTPSYYADQRSQEFFDQYGRKETGGEDAPSVELGYLNPAARGQESARYYNKRISQQFTSSGHKMPVFQDQFQDGVYIGTKMISSSGNERLDRAVLGRHNAMRDGGEGAGDEYNAEITSAQLEAIGYGDPSISGISRDVQDLRDRLDKKARIAMASISNVGDIGKSLTTWELRKKQQEEARDETLSLSEKRYEATKSKLRGAADVAKKKNTEVINKQMEQRIAQLKASGQLVVDAAGNLTAGSQQLIDKIRGDFEDRLADLNGDIDARLTNDQLTADNDYYNQQVEATTKYSDLVDQLMADEQEQAAKAFEAEEERKLEMMELTIKNLGHDDETAAKLSTELMKYEKLGPEGIRQLAPRIMNLLTQINGEQATEEDVEDWAQAKQAEIDREEMAAAAEEAGVAPLSGEALRYMNKSGNEKLREYYMKDAKGVGEAAEAWVSSPGYNSYQKKGTPFMDWFRDIIGIGDSDESYEYDNSEISEEIDAIANELDI